MDKRGFTLVELLGVIVILALIALLVFPAVNSMLKDSKEKAYDEQERQIIDAGMKYFMDNPACLPDISDELSSASNRNVCEGTVGLVQVEKLIRDGYITNDGKSAIYKGEGSSDNGVVDPRNTENKLNGFVRAKYESNQYVYDYVANNVNNSAGQWLLDNASDKAILKTFNGVYKGNNPKNYIKFNGMIWRIIKINSDDSIKIVLSDENYVSNMIYGASNVFKSSTINTYLKDDFLSNIDANKIKRSNWCVGDATNICKETYQGKIGLLSISDYIEASNVLGCDEDNLDVCNVGNYLSSMSGYLMNHNSGDGVYAIVDGKINQNVPVSANLKVRPVINVDVSISVSDGLSGDSGTFENPYIAS